MRNDLEKYKKVYDYSKESETMYSPFTPTNQFSKDKLTKLPKKNDIIDLTNIMADAAEEFNALKFQVIKLQKENKALKGSDLDVSQSSDAATRNYQKYKYMFEELSKNVSEERKKQMAEVNSV